MIGQSSDQSSDRSSDRSSAHTPHPLSPWIRRLAWWVLLLFALSVSASALRQGKAYRKRWPSEMDAFYLPPKSGLRILAFGHQELFADLIAARTYVYFGTQIATKGAQKWLGRYLDTVVTLDPYFQSIYDRGATMLVYNGQPFDEPAFSAANALLRRGLALFPDDWELWYQLGFNEIYELPKVVPRNDPRIAGWKTSGTEALRRATLFPHAPAWLATAVSNMMTEQGERALAIKHLERVYAITPDESSRAQIAYKLQQLLGADAAAAWSQERRLYEERLQRGYSYAPEAFSIIAGPRPHPTPSVVPEPDSPDASPSDAAPSPVPSP